MSSVALQTSATATNRPPQRPLQDNRAPDQASSPFASLLDNNNADTPPARPDAAQANTPQRVDQPRQTKSSDTASSDNSQPPAKSSDPASDKSSDKPKNDGVSDGLNAGAAAGAGTSDKTSESKSGGKDADKSSDKDAATDSAAVLTNQALAAAIPPPPPVAVAVPAALQPVQAEITADTAADTTAAAVASTGDATAIPAAIQTGVQAAAQTLAQNTAQGIAGATQATEGDAAALVAAVAGKTAAVGKTGASKDGAVQADGSDAADAQTDQTRTTGQPGGAQIVAPTDDKPEAATAAVPKPAEQSDEEAKAVHGKAGAEGEADKAVAAPESQKANLATLATATDSAQHSAAHAAGTAAAPQAAAGAAPTTTTMGQIANTPAAVPLAGLAVEIATYAKQGKNHFEIRLDPAELGRIDVRLDVDRHGNVTSRLMVDRADTLDLLRRDSSGLERALSDAGLKTGDNGLQFSLRDQNAGGGGNTHRDNTPANPNSHIIVPSDIPPAADMSRYRGQRLGSLDIQV